MYDNSAPQRLPLQEVTSRYMPEVLKIFYLADLFKLNKKSCIRETKNLSTDADSSNDTKKILLVRQNSQQQKIFFTRQFYTLHEEKFSNLRPLLSITFPQGFQEPKKFRLCEVGGKMTLERSKQMQKIKIFFAATILHPL